MSESAQQPDTPTDKATVTGAEPTATEPKMPPRKVMLYLVRHGQTQFNIEKRLPGQLLNVALTDEGRKQAERLGDAIREMPLSAVVTSPLERARETAQIVSRYHDTPIHEDPRLMDTDVGPWSGKVIEDLEKNDPAWKRFVHRPTHPPAGVEGFYSVLSRIVAAAEEARHNEALGNHIMLVAHADVVKLLITHYLALPIEGTHWLHIGNASLTALAFEDDHGPTLIGLNWTPAPDWLRVPPAAVAPDTTKSSTTGKSEG